MSRRGSSSLSWIGIAGLAAVGGVGALAVHKHMTRPVGDKIKAGDVALVPVSVVQIESSQPINLESLASGQLVPVEVSSFDAGRVQGVAGRNVGIRIPVSFKAADVRSATRGGAMV